MKVEWRAISRLLTWWRNVHPKRIEAVGYLLLLTGALWEAMRLQHANAVVNELALTELDVQLKLIISALESGNAQKYLDQYRPNYITATSIIPNLSDIKNWNLVGLYYNIRLVIFVIGSALVVLAKWREGRRP